MPLYKELSLKGQQYIKDPFQTCFKMYKNILLGIIICVWSGFLTKIRDAFPLQQMNVKTTFKGQPLHSEAQTFK